MHPDRQTSRVSDITDTVQRRSPSWIRRSKGKAKAKGEISRTNVHAVQSWHAHYFLGPLKAA